jgi:hypothetical protein
MGVGGILGYRGGREISSIILTPCPEVHHNNIHRPIYSAWPDASCYVKMHVAIYVGRVQLDKPVMCASLGVTVVVTAAPSVTIKARPLPRP